MTGALTKTELRVLTAIHDYMCDHNHYPEPGWVSVRVKRTSQATSNHLRSLIEKGYLEKRDGLCCLTDIARARLSTDGMVGRTEIAVQGYVYAGPGNSDTEHPDVRVHFDIAGSTTVPLIDPAPGSPIVALEVRGDSMAHENIVPGDLVLVQRFTDGQQPSEGQLIVTDYLDLRVAQPLEDMDSDLFESELQGPVLKYIYYKEGHIQLGWRTDRHQSPHTLKAARIRPFGRVVGLYRRLR